METKRRDNIYYVDDAFDFESIMREFGSESRDDFDYSSVKIDDDDLNKELEDILGPDFGKTEEPESADEEPELELEDDDEAEDEAEELEVDEDDEVEDEDFEDEGDEPEEDESEAPTEKEVFDDDDAEGYAVTKDGEEHFVPDAELLDQIINDFSDGSEHERTVKYNLGDRTIKEQSVSDGDADKADYAEDADYEEAPETKKKFEMPKAVKEFDFKKSVVNPFIAFTAMVALRVRQSRLTLSDSINSEEDLGEEMAPDKASKFYASKLASLRMRTRISFVLSLIMMYISFGGPVFGAMVDTGVKAAVCTILLIAVMICGLDILTSGIMSIVHRRPHANALIALSALFCVIDGFIIAAGMKTVGLPFSVVPALTVSFSLMGSIMNARSNRIVFNTVSSTRNPSTVTAENSVSGDGVTVRKARLNPTGFVRRTEEAGPDETVYSVMAPYLLIAGLVLSLIAAIATKSFPAFAHILSGIFVCAAPVAMLITYPLPNFVSAKTLLNRGSAIAGWSGIYDIGNCKNLIITDKDLFPGDTIRISRVRIFAGLKAQKVVSLAGSIVAASGSSLCPAFRELMVQGKGKLLTVENFRCHEGGGFIAMVDGVEVFCGNASFMHLMGVHLPEKYKFKNCIYLSEGDAICGMFEMEYSPAKSVKDALYMLLRSGRHGVFAVRDFNITPSLLSTKFDIATESFDFPPFDDRYELSDIEATSGSKPAALISREGLAAYINLAEHGRNLYARIRICVLLSVLSTIIGMLLMFVLCLKGYMTVSIALIYMLIWLIPVIIIGFYFKD